MKKSRFSEKVFEFLMSKAEHALDLSTRMVFEPRKMAGFSYKSPGGYFSKNINNLKRSPYFEIVENKFYVTPKGRIKIIKNILKEKKNGNKKWDGFWRAVVFDIPVATNRARDLLRRELKWMGFVEAQKSFWVTPLNVEKELAVLLKLWAKDLKGNIKVMRIEKITDDKDLRKYFKV